MIEHYLIRDSAICPSFHPCVTSQYHLKTNARTSRSFHHPGTPTSVPYVEHDLLAIAMFLVCTRVTTCLENLELSENLTAVREMSGILLKIREKSCHEKVA